MAQSMGPTTASRDRRFIAAAMDAPMLEREYEMSLGRRWRDDADAVALHEIINAHVRLVVRIASNFRGYGLPLSDLIQEGNIGLLQAANRFDPERNIRFSTYASWWILAGVQEYIVRNASIVRIGTTPAQKSLFFNLRRLRAKIGGTPGSAMTDEDRRGIARRLRVPLAAVERMEAHISRPDRSLNAGIGGAETDEMQDFLPDDGPTPEELVLDSRDRATRSKWLKSALATLSPREQQIIRRRFLKEDRTTLAEIGKTYGVTKERIRQIEGKALAKLRTALLKKYGDEAQPFAA
jgi:RNA polymerase sigma-32 factor